MDFLALQDIVASDASGRGPSVLCRPPFWRDALRLCREAGSVVIVTGFFIRSASAPETDGPPGAVALGRALERMGKRVELWTDVLNLDCLAACSAAVKGPSVVCVDGRSRADGDLLVFVERPGHAGDGRYYDMRGEDVGAVVAPLDLLAERALAEGRPVLAIGDGGNEAGMGFLYEELARLIPRYAPYLSRVPSTVCLPVDVSNWGAYALSAVLSVSQGEWLGADPEEEGAMLEALVAAGAVDGVSRRRGLLVDGMPVAKLKEVAFQIQKWYLKQGAGE